MTRRTSFSLLLLLVLAVLVLASCGGDVEGPGEENGGATGDDAASTEPDGDGTAAASACVDGDTTGVTDSTILVGNTTPLSGQIGFIGEEGNQGFQVVLDQVNADGGIDGREVELVSYDDAYDPSQAQTGTRRLVEEDNIFVYAGGIGTPNFVAAMPYLENAEIPAIGPYGPARDIGTMEHPYVFMIWTNFIDEFEAVADYLVTEEGMGMDGDVAFVYYQTDTGNDALDGTKTALDRHGVELVSQVSTDPTETDWASIALELKNSGAEWVGMQISSTHGGQLLEAMRDIDYSPGAFGQSDFLDASFFETFPEVSNGFYAPMKIRPFSDEDPQWQEIQSTYESATGDSLTTWSAVGYAQALLTVEALEQAEALTRECVYESLEGIEGFETGIVPPLTFGPETRTGVVALGLAQIVDQEVVTVLPFEEAAN